MIPVNDISKKYEIFQASNPAQATNAKGETLQTPFSEGTWFVVRHRRTLKIIYNGPSLTDSYLAILNAMNIRIASPLLRKLFFRGGKLVATDPNTPDDAVLNPDGTTQE